MNFSNQTEVEHKYGTVYLDTWYDVYGHRNGHGIEKLDGYKIKFHDSIEKPYTVQGIRTMIKSSFGYLAMSNNKYSVTHVMLASAFPHIQTEETVNHINENHKDNRIQNLRWMSWSENSKIGQAKSVRNIHENGGKKGKYVLLTTEDDLPIKSFISVDNCARYIIDNWDLFKKRYDSPVPQLKTIAAKIHRAFEHPNHKPYGCKFKYSETFYEGEDWVDVPRKFYAGANPDKKYMISSHGRMRTSQNIIAVPERSRDNPKYHTYNVYGRKHLVHRLMWQSFRGDIPDGMDICHDDKVPLINKEYYRNYLCDLRVGTRSDNMREFHGKSDEVGVDDEVRDEEKTGDCDAGTDMVMEMELCGVKQGRCAEVCDDDDEIDLLMKSPPSGIQYVKATDKRGSKYVISRRLTPEGRSDISSTGKRSVSDKNKFIEVYEIYKKIVSNEYTG